MMWKATSMSKHTTSELWLFFKWSTSMLFIRISLLPLGLQFSLSLCRMKKKGACCTIKWHCFRTFRLQDPNDTHHPECMLPEDWWYFCVSQSSSSSPSQTPGQTNLSLWRRLCKTEQMPCSFKQCTNSTHFSINWSIEQIIQLVKLQFLIKSLLPALIYTDQLLRWAKNSLFPSQGNQTMVY